MAGSVLAKMVMVLFCSPILPRLLNRTRTDDFAPGATGSRGHSGVVHPHDAVILLIISGNSPVLVKAKTCSTVSPSVKRTEVMDTRFGKGNSGHLCRRRFFGGLALLPVIATDLPKTYTSYSRYKQPIS